MQFALPHAQRVRLRIYDVEGRLVRTLVDERREAGRHVVAWSGDDDGGRRVASGLYFYRLSTDDATLTRKMLLLK
jgi:flagellar hook assembly protein FlgD